MDNEKRNTRWKKIIGILALGLSALGSLILSIILGVQKSDASLGISLFCSCLSIILSVVALWYTFKSGISMDSQFDELKYLISQMREVQHQLDTSINQLAQIEDELSPELKAKIGEFKANLKKDSFRIL